MSMSPSTVAFGIDAMRLKPKCSVNRILLVFALETTLMTQFTFAILNGYSRIAFTNCLLKFPSTAIDDEIEATLYRSNITPAVILPSTFQPIDTEYFGS